MGTTQRQVMMEQLFDLEQTIVRLKLRIGQLQKSLHQESTMSADRPIKKRSSLRSLFGGKPAGMSASMIRENRRVERHAASLF